MAMQKPKNGQSLLGKVLKEYRKEHNLTQEQLAYDLSIEPRTVRSWENEHPTNNINELRRIADLLGIRHERLGIAASIYVPHTSEQIEEIVNHVWELIEEARIQEAQTIISQLLEGIKPLLLKEDKDILRSAAHAYHAAGYTASVNLRSHESYKAIPFYHQVEAMARVINDDTLLNIGLTYQGDMYQRLGDTSKAIEYLKAAKDTTPQADKAALGNGIQLLGRAYFRLKNLNDFEREMAKSEELTQAFDSATSSTKGHYSLGTVYEEYGRSYANLGQMDKALEYLNLAKVNLPDTKFWGLLLDTAKALALVKGGEIDEGIKVAVEAGEQCIATGNIRFLDRIHIIEQYLEDQQKRLGEAKSDLREVLLKGRTTEI